MLKKTVFPNLDPFRPPEFDLKRYDQETEAWGYRAWSRAIHRRVSVKQCIEAFEKSDGKLEDHFYGSRKYTEEKFREQLPHLFDPIASLNDGQKAIAADYSLPLVTDLTIQKAVQVFCSLERDALFQRTLECSDYNTENFDVGEYGVPLDFWERPVYLLLNREASNDRKALRNYQQESAYSAAVQVNLHAPDSDILDSFAKWLEQARKTYHVLCPKPKVLRRKKPEITRKLLEGWRDKRILAFLDLFLWNRFYNPPPVEGLWQPESNGFWQYGGQRWTTPYPTWIDLLELSLEIDDDGFRNHVRKKALDLVTIPYDMMSLLDAQALREDSGLAEEWGKPENRVEYFTDFDPDRILLRKRAGPKN